MKTAISLPDELFYVVEKYTKKHELYQRSHRNPGQRHHGSQDVRGIPSEFKL